MDLELLASKLNIIKDGVEITDLTTASVKYSSFDFFIIDGFKVSTDLEMRADLLSQAVYGNTHNWDVILKFNGISNPYALSVDDLILIPELGWMDTQMHDPVNDSLAQDIRSQYLDSTKTTDIDNKKKDYDKMVKDLYSVNKTAKFNKVALPPNLAQFGESEVATVNGAIKLGPNS